MIIAILLVIRLSELMSPPFPVPSSRGHVSIPSVILLLGFTVHNHGASFADTSLSHVF